MEPLTASQFQVMLVAWDLAGQLGAFRAWDVTHLAGERYGYRGHPAIQRLLKLLVDKGYLRYDREAGERAGLYDVEIDAETATRVYVDHFLETLGDDSRILEIAAIRLRQHIDSASLAAAAV
jgi:hypothetical protein